MERKRIFRLRKDLVQYKSELIHSNNYELSDTIQIIIDNLGQQLDEPAATKKSDIKIIIDLIEKGNIDKIYSDYPKIKYDNLKKAVSSRIDINLLANYTILELKVLYYLLTKDKENNAIKTNKKVPVLNAVKEVIFNNMRNQKLESK